MGNSGRKRRRSSGMWFILSPDGPENRVIGPGRNRVIGSSGEVKTKGRQAFLVIPKKADSPPKTGARNDSDTGRVTLFNFPLNFPLDPITRWPDHPILSHPMTYDFRAIRGSEAFKAAVSNAYNQAGSHFSSLLLT